MTAVLIIVVVALFAVFTLAGAIWFAWDSDKRVRKFARSTDLIPGKPGRAPQDWTTASTPEALLHRRIRYAIADVHQNPAIPHHPDVLAERDRLDDAVFALDDDLIAAASLPDGQKQERIDAVETAVTQLEALPRELWEAPADKQREDIARVVGAIGRV